MDNKSELKGKRSLTLQFSIWSYKESFLVCIHPVSYCHLLAKSTYCLWKLNLNIVSVIFTGGFVTQYQRLQLGKLRQELHFTDVRSVISSYTLLYTCPHTCENKREHLLLSNQSAGKLSLITLANMCDVEES